MTVATKLGRVVTCLAYLNPLITWSLKQKSTYFKYQSAYGHQTWQDANRPLRAPTHKVTWQNRVTN